jgi:hypothetical protein
MCGSIAGQALRHDNAGRNILIKQMLSRQFGFIWSQFSGAWNNLKSRALYDSQPRDLEARRKAMAATSRRGGEAREPAYGGTAPRSTAGNFAADKSGGTLGEIQKNAAQKLSSMEAAVRRNPAQSALIAAGAGFLFGLVFTR